MSTPITEFVVDVFRNGISGCLLRLQRRNKVDSYEVVDGQIVKYSSRDAIDQRIDISSIVEWSIPVREMTFDVVEVTLRDGSVLRWEDRWNDLIEILSSVANDKRKG